MRHAGYSLLELVVLTALIATVTAVAIPNVLATVNDSRTVGAARYISAQLQLVRMEAVARSADAGLKFLRLPDGY